MDIKCDLALDENFKSNNIDNMEFSKHNIDKNALTYVPDSDLTNLHDESLVEDNTYNLENPLTLTDGSLCKDDNSLKHDSDVTSDLTMKSNQTNNNNIDNMNSFSEEINPIPNTTAEIINEQKLRNNISQSNMTDSLESENTDRFNLEDGIFYDCMEIDKSPIESKVFQPKPIPKTVSSSSSEGGRINLDGESMDFSSSEWLYTPAPDSSLKTQFNLDEWLSFPKTNLTTANKGSSQSLLVTLSSPMNIDNCIIDNNTETVKNPPNLVFQANRFVSSPQSAPDRSLNQQRTPQKVSRLATRAAPITTNTAPHKSTAANPKTIVTPNNNIIGAHYKNKATRQPTSRNVSNEAPQLGAIGASHNAVNKNEATRQPTSTNVSNEAPQLRAIGAPHNAVNKNETPRLSTQPNAPPEAPHSRANGAPQSGIRPPQFTNPTGGPAGSPLHSKVAGSPHETAANPVGAPRVTQIVRVGGPADSSPRMTISQKMCFSKSKPLLDKLVEPAHIGSNIRQIRPPGTVAKTALAVSKRSVAGPPLSVEQLDASVIRQNLIRGDQIRRHTIVDMMPMPTAGDEEAGPVSAPGTRRKIARPTSLVKPSNLQLNNNHIISDSGHDNSDTRCCSSPSESSGTRPVGSPQSAIPMPSVGPPIPSHNVPTLTTAVAMTPSTAMVATNRGSHDDNGQQLNRTFDRDQFRVLKSFTNTVTNDKVPGNSGSDASTDTLRSSSDSENNNSHPSPLTTMKTNSTSIRSNSSGGFPRKLGLLPNPSENEPGIYQLARKEEEDLKKHVRSSLAIRQQQQPQQPSPRNTLTKTSPVRPRGIPKLRK